MHPFGCIFRFFAVRFFGGAHSTNHGPARGLCGGSCKSSIIGAFLESEMSLGGSGWVTGPFSGPGPFFFLGGGVEQKITGGKFKFWNLSGIWGKCLCALGWIIGLMYIHIYIYIYTGRGMSNVTFAVVYFCESRESPRFLPHPAGSILGAPEEIVRPRDRLVKVGAKPISILVGFQNGVPKIMVPPNHPF